MPASDQGAKKSISIRLNKLPQMTTAPQRENVAEELAALVEYLYEHLKSATEERDCLAKKMDKIRKAMS